MAGYGYWVAVCFTINYVIGSGILTLPWAFDASGLVLAALILTVMAIFSVVTSYQLLETMARASALETRFGADAISSAVFSPMSSRHIYGAIRGTDSLNRVDEPGNEPGSGGQIELVESDFKPHLRSRSGPLQLGDRKFEIAELCGIFLGNTARRLYVASISLYFYGALWAYSTVFARAWSNILPVPGLNQAESYYVYLAWWAVVECSWCLFELDEQITVQVALAIGRILMVCTMIGTVLACDFSGHNSFDIPSDAPGHQTFGGVYHLWVPSNMYIILPVSIYALVMHHSVPTIVRPVRDKRQAGHIFAMSFAISYVAYLVLALVVSAYFGQYANTSSNLNWMHYKGFNPSDAQLSGADDIPLYAKIVTAFVVIFPSLDVASAFPLNAITLGNNLMATYYGSSALPDAERSWYKRSFFRLLAAVPPVLAAGLVQDLGPITAYTGLTGIVIALITPAMLAYASEQDLMKRGMQSRTGFSLPGTSGVLAIVIAATGCCALIYILYSLITHGVPKVLS